MIEEQPTLATERLRLRTYRLDDAARPQKLAGQRDGISKQAIECYELLIEHEAPSND